MENALVLIIYSSICLVVGYCARRMMQRSMLVWTVLGLFFTPLVAFVFLLVAGRPYDPVAEIREHAEAKELRGIAETERVAEHVCPSCGSPVNLSTRKGVNTVDSEEPWRISCASCSHELDAARL